jgi:hypothetical protein
MDQTSKAATIAALNDRFRKEGPSDEIPGQAVLTQGIAALSFARQLQIRIEVTSYDRFEPGDDPYGEHDFGAFDLTGVGTVYWKIDYYAPDMEHGSEDPTDPDQTVRVLTIMLASEY